MGTTIKSLAIIAVASLSAATTASAEERGYSASGCSHSTSASNLFYTFQGVEVTNLSSGTLHCSAATLLGSSVDRVEATVYDRNPSSNVCCQIAVLNNDGMGVASASRCSTGSANPSQLLSATFPANVAGAVYMSCSIPAVHVSGGPSRVTTYRVLTTP